MNISLKKPANQPLTPYTTDDAQWKAFQEAVSRTPQRLRRADDHRRRGGPVAGADRVDRSVDGGGLLHGAEGDGGPRQGRGRGRAARRKNPGPPSPPSTGCRSSGTWSSSSTSGGTRSAPSRRSSAATSLPSAPARWAEMIDFIRFNPWFYLQLMRTDMGDGDRETNTMNLRALKGFTCAITPFNFPIAIGYNLPTVMALCGNTVVWKPSSDAPMTSWMLMRAIQDAGFPPGVINMITGPGSAVMPPVLQAPRAHVRELHGRLRHGPRRSPTSSSAPIRRDRTSRASWPRREARTSSTRTRAATPGTWPPASSPAPSAGPARSARPTAWSWSTRRPGPRSARRCSSR